MSETDSVKLLAANIPDGLDFRRKRFMLGEQSEGLVKFGNNNKLLFQLKANAI
jgi:hypothetical protein